MTPEGPWAPPDLVTRARQIAADHRLTAGGRLLVTGRPDPRTALAAWAVPMVADVTVVLVAGVDPAPIARSEHVTERLTGEP